MPEYLFVVTGKWATRELNQLTVIIVLKASGFLEYPADPPSCSIVCRISSFLHTNINDKQK